MKWIKVKLTDISKPKQWKNLPISEMSEEGYLVYGANGVIGKYKEYNHEFPTLAITCRGATCGTLNITEPKSYITSNAMALDGISENVNQKFLYYALKKRGFKDIITGAAQPQITVEGLSKIVLNIPENISEQLHIANLLSKAENLIAQRKESILLLDEFLKSTFLEMFGEIFIEQTEVYHSIGSCCYFIDYRGKTLERVKSGIPYISAKCVRQYYFDYSRIDYITEESYEKVMTRGFPKPNDVLFTTEGATMGFVCRIPKHLTTSFSVGQRLITLQCNESLTPEFLEYTLNNNEIQKQIFKRSSGSAAIGIRAAEFSEIKIPVPPLPLQNKFSQIVTQTETLKEQYKNSLQELENLYGALSQKAFNGELEFNKPQTEEAN